MGESSGHWRTIEHTADLAIEIEAQSPEALFVVAAHGMTGILRGEEAGALDPLAPTEHAGRELTLGAPDRESLLVEWLRELLYIQISEGTFFAQAEIGELSDKALRARVRFSESGGDSEFERELKGVTYHDLEVAERGDDWYARVVFDV